MPYKIAGTIFDQIKIYYNQVETGTEDTISYCPQNNTGFYDIEFRLPPEELDLGYCPQDNDGFYDFTQPPS